MEWAQATAQEFKVSTDLVLQSQRRGRVIHVCSMPQQSKGANVVLGPGLNVHRVPRGGRNAEYMSGEDPFLGSCTSLTVRSNPIHLTPFLGATLAKPYVEGYQSNGLIAVMKHFALNNQVTSSLLHTIKKKLKCFPGDQS